MKHPSFPFVLFLGFCLFGAFPSASAQPDLAGSWGVEAGLGSNFFVAGTQSNSLHLGAWYHPSSRVSIGLDANYTPFSHGADDPLQGTFAYFGVREREDRFSDLLPNGSKSQVSSLLAWVQIHFRPDNPKYFIGGGFGLYHRHTIELARVGVSNGNITYTPESQIPSLQKWAGHIRWGFHTGKWKSMLIYNFLEPTSKVNGKYSNWKMVNHLSLHTSIPFGFDQDGNRITWTAESGKQYAPKSRPLIRLDLGISQTMIPNSNFKRAALFQVFAELNSYFLSQKETVGLRLEYGNKASGIDRQGESFAKYPMSGIPYIRANARLEELIGLKVSYRRIIKKNKHTQILLGLEPGLFDRTTSLLDDFIAHPGLGLSTYLQHGANRIGISLNVVSGDVPTHLGLHYGLGFPFGRLRNRN